MKRKTLVEDVPKPVVIVEPLEAACVPPTFTEAKSKLPEMVAVD